MKAGVFRSSAMRYTRLVVFSRNILWVLVVLVVLLVVWISVDDSKQAGSRLVFSHVKINENLENEMENPHYQGLDANNRPYTVIAEKAIQKDKDTVLLKIIDADMQQENGAWLALKAGSGELNIVSKKLWLSDGVNLFYEGGYEMRTDKAFVDIAAGAAYGEVRVEGQGPLGTLTANRFEVERRGEVIRFNGSVRLKIYR